jgi:isopropylmalate/homocitrate/citramalate synthase
MDQDATRIIVFDTTLRDGEQAPGFSMDVASKLNLARALDALGVDIIEAGFPIASPADSEGTRQIAREVRRPVIAASLGAVRQTSMKRHGRWSRRNVVAFTRSWPRRICTSNGSSALRGRRASNKSSTA